MKNDNQVDALFRFLFIKQCNELNTYLPKLFEKTSDYTELMHLYTLTELFFSELRLPISYAVSFLLYE